MSSGVLLKFYEYVLFNLETISIFESVLEIKELGHLASEKIKQIIFHNLCLVDDQGNFISETEALKLVLKLFTNTRSDDVYLKVSSKTIISSNWEKILYESGRKFSKVIICVETEKIEEQNQRKKLFKDAEFLYKFVSSQRENFELVVCVDDNNYEKRYHPDFLKYFKEAPKQKSSDLCKRQHFTVQSDIYKTSYLLIN